MFDIKKYLEKADDFMKKHGVIEDGNASRRVADAIEKYIFG
jgi:hypothetical protein